MTLRNIHEHLRYLLHLDVLKGPLQNIDNGLISYQNLRKYWSYVDGSNTILCAKTLKPLSLQQQYHMMK